MTRLGRNGHGEYRPAASEQERLDRRRASWRESKRRLRAARAAVVLTVDDDSKDYKAWWLERHTTQEIRQFWGAISDTIMPQTNRGPSCEHCGAAYEYRPEYPTQKYCSVRCRKNAQRRTPAGIEAYQRKIEERRTKYYEARAEGLSSREAKKKAA